MKRAELQAYIDEAEGEALSACADENPFVAWTRFIDRLDAIGRRKIGDKLESEGKNRYTGEPQTEAQRDELRKMRKRLMGEISEEEPT